MLVVALLLLAGCDKLFLDRNDIPVDSRIDAPIDGPPPAGCPPEFAGQRYLSLGSMQMSWPEAERTCRALGYSFSHLAVVGDLAEAVLIDPLIAGDSWVGLTNEGQPPVFHWITTEAASIPWYPGQPDNDGKCGRLMKGGMGVSDTPCSEKRRVICECDDFIVDKSRF